MIHGDEEWRSVPGYEGSYEVSSIGRVKSLPRNTTRGGILAGATEKTGYPNVRLSHNGVKKTWRVHRLVALAFLGPPPSGCEVRHLDGDPANNRVENLKYDSHLENMRDIKRHGRHNHAGKTHCVRGHEFTPENTRIKPTKYGTARQCLTCVQIRNRERWAAVKRAKEEAA